MQNSRDAVDSLLRKRPADYTPLHDHIWGDTLRQWHTQGLPSDADGNPVDPVDHFDFDIAETGGWFDWHANPGVSEIVEETSEWKVVRNGSGALLKWWKHKSGTPEHVDFQLTGRDVWDRDFRPRLLTFDRCRLGNLDDARKKLARRRAQGKWTQFGHQFIWENMRASMGDYVMYTSLISDPDWLHDFNRVYTDLYKTAFRILFDEVGKPDGVWLYEDLGYRDRLFCSPAVLEELIFPYYKEMVDFFHGYDLPVVLHSCGCQRPALPLIVQTGFDGLNPMEAKAGNDLFAYAEQYGDQLAFIGGLDARVLETGDRDQIRLRVTELVDGMRERGARFVYGSDHSVSTNVAYADFAYAIDIYRSRRLPPR
ncbi:MAG: hypothetical protein K8T26_16755 [Lentisphaerae bacterium]|nr:hypothetical protein [Lentisphaerota bacterium]